MINQNLYNRLGVFLLAACLIACGKAPKAENSTQGAAAENSPQIAAIVDESEISVLQIDHLMKNASDVTSVNVTQIRQQILEKLIDQQLLVDKALDEKLDRTPDVLIAIEAATREVLAQAYIQKMVANGVRIGNKDIKKYFEAQPGLFANRKIYALQDVGIEKKEQLIDAIEDKLANKSDIAELTIWLKDQDIKFSAEGYTKPAEQLPLEILPKLSVMKDGSIAVFEMPTAIHIIKLIKSESAPIDLEAATPLIKSYLTEVEANKLIEEKIDKFRKIANIKYMGEFSINNSDIQDTANKNNG